MISHVQGILLQCSLFVTQQPRLVSQVRLHSLLLLTGKSLDWVTAVWQGDGSAFPSFDLFLQCFKEVFDHSAGGRSAGEQLLALSQGKTTAAEYALAFRTLAAQTTWVEDTLKLLFRRGLNVDLQAKLACHDEGRNLSDFIELTIQIDNLMRSRRSSHSQCFNPSPPGSKVTNELSMQIGVLHKEILKFYVISSPTHPLILGLPWLRKHDPYISWREGEIKQWGSACHEQCISHNTPVSVSTITLTQENSEVANLPSEYADLPEAFSKVKASELPLHRSSDCSIELIPSSTPPKGRNISLSQPEAEAMKKYVEEELGKGLHSTHLPHLLRLASSS